MYVRSVTAAAAAAVRFFTRDGIHHRSSITSLLCMYVVHMYDQHAELIPESINTPKHVGRGPINMRFLPTTAVLAFDPCVDAEDRHAVQCVHSYHALVCLCVCVCGYICVDRPLASCTAAVV